MKNRIIVNERIQGDYFKLVFDAPEIAENASAGSFTHIRIDERQDRMLRRPFSIHDTDPGRGSVTVVYKVVGRGTAVLSALKAGDTVDAMGPLGRGFPVSCKGVPLLVGGGYGVAPLYFLAKRLMAKGCDPRPVLFVGGRTRDDLLALDRFSALGIEVRTATNDGSDGVKGFVTEPLDDALIDLRQKGADFELFTCGPDGLLKAVAMRATGTGMPGWISMDRHMICGVGACFACIQKVKLPNGDVFNARCCVNGPVFKAEDLVW